MVHNKDGRFICRATNYRKSEENIKHTLIDLPNNLSKPCIKLLEKSGLVTIIRNKCYEIASFKIILDCFHPKKRILPWKYGDDNISPCETRTFTECRSIQNIQCLSGSGGSCKYICKYVGKIEKNNYWKVSTSADGSFIGRAIFLQNAKHFTSNKSQQSELDNKCNRKHPQGTVISFNEVWHQILKYP